MERLTSDQDYVKKLLEWGVVMRSRNALKVTREPTEPEIEPHFKLAVAVLKEALLDATGQGRPTSRPHRRISDRRREIYWQEKEMRMQEAREFLLEDEEDFSFWCRVAGLDPDQARKQFSQIIQRGTFGSRNWCNRIVRKGGRR